MSDTNSQTTRVLSWHWLGVGAASALQLGSSSAVLEVDARPLLLIDCGPATWQQFLDRYAALPPALFITHAHMDHIGGLEQLFYKAWFARPRRLIPLFVPVGVIATLHQRLATYPSLLAEGGANFWDAFQLIPVSEGFWWRSLWFDVFPTRHHQAGSSCGLALRGSFVYTGDTRPIPEQLLRVGDAGEIIFHDCGLVGNPSHTGLDDLAREYTAAQRARMQLYHYGSDEDGASLVAAGYRIAQAGQTVPLRAAIGADASADESN